MNVQLSADLLASAQSLVAAGRYQSVDEVVAEGLRLLADREWLRAEVQKGIDQADRGALTDGKAAIEQIKGRLESTKK